MNSIWTLNFFFMKLLEVTGNALGVKNIPSLGIIDLQKYSSCLIMVVLLLCNFNSGHQICIINTFIGSSVVSGASLVAQR